MVEVAVDIEGDGENQGRCCSYDSLYPVIVGWAVWENICYLKNGIQVVLTK